MTAKLVLVRHGQSQWNLENRFTGWVDVDISEKGREEAQQAGKLLKEQNIQFEVAFTSVLKRAIRTLWVVLDEMDMMWLPVVRTWKLNERHYGALQGLDKAETQEKHGKEQVHKWRRGYKIQPPPLETDDPMNPAKDPRYAKLSSDEIPLTESLFDTLNRVIPYWDSTISPHLRRGENVLIAAHGNSLRALVKHLDGISDEDIPNLNIPTGAPLLYEFDDDLNIIHKGYLGDAEAVKAAAEAVARQTEGK